MSQKVGKRLMVIIPDRLSDLVEKGEITERYYNPGNLFDEVHIVMTNDDIIDSDLIQKTVGDAKLHIHNVPGGSNLFIRSLGWQPATMESWVKIGIRLARDISPSLVRTHNNFKEGYLAKRIKDELSIPYIVSLHGVWDRDCSTAPKERLIKAFRTKLEKTSLKDADGVIAVYKPIVRYANEYGAKKVELIYNVVAGEDINKKDDYNLSSPPRIITINRQVKEKNPENIIKAIKNINCYYLIVGDGYYHEQLKQVARENGCGNKIEFIKSIPNHQLCSMLKDFDIMVSHCDYWGISKTIIEASLAGLPVIINNHPIEPIPDYEGDWLLQCDNSVEGYEQAILYLLRNNDIRTSLGKKAYTHACEFFDPVRMEEKIVQLYLNAMGVEEVKKL